jgi:hypothetical protein
VAMFDDSVCIGLPQYARFHTGVTVTPVDSMPWYYNKVYSRKDWPKARALLQTKYDFHEVIRVRYLINAFVEKVGNEYFYPISDWPMVTVDPDDPTKFELDVKTKTRMHTCAWDPAHDECGDPYQETPKEPIYLESTIEKSVWDKLTADQKVAFAPITELTEYRGNDFPLIERLDGEDMPETDRFSK